MNNKQKPDSGQTFPRMTTVALAVSLLFSVGTSERVEAQTEALPGHAGAPYQQMPTIAPPGVRVDRYLPLPEDALAPPVDAAKGYRIQNLGRGLYMVTDNAYQSMFMVCETGVVVVDAPPAYAAHLKKAIAEVTDKPITHIVYSHSHADHIGGAGGLGGHPVIIAQEETKRLLLRDNDPNRPIPTLTFKDQYTLKVGGQVLELSYHGVAHEPGNIFIYAPAQKTLMVVDVVFPGWMPWRRFALAKDVPGYFQQVADIDKVPFETLVGGHVSRVGTHADVRLQLEFMNDIKAAAATALKTTPFGAEMNPADKGNPWAGFDNYIDRVAGQCVRSLTPKWQSRLAGYDVYIWDQCFAMEQSLRID
ncbi:MBL fold metallo-hydrolase [Bradyrhizobium sp. AUGA SZCCT0176]|uniref:MBL fold metallo-hydrolase n=1 Tax=Bradyrhizobium sp. AUGA SZCCT0176 TaxID=2807664 RepID=UPI002013873A|nr:MBL fold metallo-hydrolase [Bradyrhizobium sp. AUGA SZCCT0176]